MTEHESWLELLSASLDGELSDADRAALEEHLAACPECRRVQEAFQAIGENFPEETEAPANFTEGTMYLIRQEAGRPQGWKKFFGNYGRWTGVAAAVVVLLLGFGAVRGGLLKAPSANKAAGGAAVNSTAASAPAEREETAAESVVVTMDTMAGGESEEADEEMLSASLQASSASGGAEAPKAPAMAGGAITNGMESGGGENQSAAAFGAEIAEAEEEAAMDSVWEAEAPAETEADPAAMAAEPEPEAPAPEAGAADPASISRLEQEAPAEEADGDEPEAIMGEDRSANEGDESSTLSMGTNTALSPAALMERFGGMGWYAVGVLDVLSADTEGLKAEPELGAGCFSLPRAEMDALIKSASLISMFFDEDAAERGLVIVLSEGE